MYIYIYDISLFLAAGLHTSRLKQKMIMEEVDGCKSMFGMACQGHRVMEKFKKDNSPFVKC
jgi:hypothetical protein